MELTCLPGIDIGGMFGCHYQWVTDYSILHKYVLAVFPGREEGAYYYARKTLCIGI